MKQIIKYIAKQFGKPEGFGGILSTFVMNLLNRKLYRSIIEILQIDKNDTILDIGFGNGFLLNKIAKRKPKKMFGIEISRDMIFAANKRNKSYISDKKMELIEADVQHLPYSDASIDKIYTVNTVYFWKNTKVGFNEILRVLKPNGLFINAIYTKNWLDKLIITKYGFSKFADGQLENETVQSGFSSVQTIEIQRNKSLCIIAKK
jgi:ubiquinone/menaquinone biosynthesis C-methylase UbiE